MAETDVPNWLNSSFLETALRSGGYGPSVTVTSSEIGRATGAGDNYLSDVYRAKLQVTLEGRRLTVSLIVKAQPAEGEAAEVNIRVVFCLMIYIGDIRSILNRKTLSIFFLHIHVCGYVYMCYQYVRMCNILVLFTRNRIFCCMGS
jgi:hypothetical protein